MPNKLIDIKTRQSLNRKDIEYLQQDIKKLDEKLNSQSSLINKARKEINDLKWILILVIVLQLSSISPSLAGAIIKMIGG